MTIPPFHSARLREEKRVPIGFHFPIGVHAQIASIDGKREVIGTGGKEG